MRRRVRERVGGILYLLMHHAVGAVAYLGSTSVAAAAAAADAAATVMAGADKTLPLSPRKVTQISFT